MFDWNTFLNQWRQASEDSDKPASSEPGASEEELTALEARIGKPLPPSYRAFLAETNGWRPPGYLINRIRPAREVDWFAKENQLLVDAYTRPGQVAEDDPIHQLKTTLQISDKSDSAVLLLNLNVIDNTSGEWEAWYFSHSFSDENRYTSFQKLMQFKYQYLLQMKEWRTQAEKARQQPTRLRKLLHALWTLVGRILTFPLYLIFRILIFIYEMLYRSDKRFGTDFTPPKITIDEVEDLVNINLPGTANMPDVISFLELFNIPHSSKVYEDLRWHAWKKLSQLPSELDKKTETIRKYTWARIDNVGRDWFVTYDIVITFYFDEDDNLVTYVVDGQATGL
jgi:hypothetical protein